MSIKLSSVVCLYIAAFYVIVFILLGLWQKASGVGFVLGGEKVGVHR